MAQTETPLGLQFGGVVRRISAPYTPGVKEEKSPQYPWQLELPPWAPAANLSETQRRRRYCGILFAIEKAIVEAGVGDDALVYDPEADVFRFPDGRFGLSREHADWGALKAAGYFSEWGM